MALNFACSSKYITLHSDTNVPMLWQIFKLIDKLKVRAGHVKACMKGVLDLFVANIT